MVGRDPGQRGSVDFARWQVVRIYDLIPKGLNMAAQGNALGRECSEWY